MNLKDIYKAIIDLPNSKVESVINEYVRGFRAERNRVILKDKLLLGMTYEEVAEKHDMSVRQVKNVVSDTAQMIVPHLGVGI